jgi:hypothetical protein
VVKIVAFSPPPTANEVDMLYRQLTEIHAINGVQLVKCTD